MQGVVADRGTLNSRQFYIAVRRLADTLSYGTDSSPFRGSGIEFVQSRPYMPGDPVKSIDWRVTARMGRMHVKEYVAPRRLPVYLLVDTSASMTLRSGVFSKYELAVYIAGGIAFACLDRVSPVGLLGVGGRNLRVEPSLSKQQIMQWLHELRTYRYDEPTRLGERIAELSPTLANSALVIVLSDLHDGDGLTMLKRLAQRHDCVVLQFRDPAESQLRGAGFLRAREAETGRAFVTHGRAQWIDHERIAEELKRSMIDQMMIDTDKPFAERLRQFFRARGVLARGGR